MVYYHFLQSKMLTPSQLVCFSNVITCEPGWKVGQWNAECLTSMCINNVPLAVLSTKLFWNVLSVSIDPLLCMVSHQNVFHTWLENEDTWVSSDFWWWWCKSTASERLFSSQEQRHTYRIIELLRPEKIIYSSHQHNTTIPHPCSSMPLLHFSWTLQQGSYHRSQAEIIIPEHVHLLM